MGTLTKTFTEYGSGASTWTVNISCDDVVASGASFNIYDLLSSTAKFVNANKSLGAVNNKFQFTMADYTSNYNYQWFKKGSGVNGTDSMTSNVFYPMTKGGTYGLTTINTSWVFNSNNSTSRTANIEVYSTHIYLRSANSTFERDNSCSDNTTISWGNVATVTLDVPPTATVSAISYDKGYVYAGLTTASVTISSATAYYGGTVNASEFVIGNQTATGTGDGTLSIALDTPGTFTPTVTITDSRGQTKTYTLDPITVNTYTAPTISFDVDRTDSTGTPDDEGTYGFIEAILTFSDAVATAVAPSVVLTDENGTQTTPVVSWYTDNALTTPVVWASVSSGDTVYGIFSGVNTNYSYSVSVRPRDSEGTGTAITQTISAAFYTVDFLAGGHGIAFGQPASATGFECNMPTIFHDTVEVEDTLTAQDMTQQEVDDFVDSLNVGGGGVAVDLVVEEGTSGIWTYRKWSSGIAECWGKINATVSCTRQYSNLYIQPVGSIYPRQTFPFEFIAAPNCSISLENINGWLMPDGLVTTTQTQAWWLVRTASSSNLNVYVSYYAIGRWK